MVATLRHHSQPIGGASRRQPIAARGASRMVAKEPLSARLPKANFSVENEKAISTAPTVNFGAPAAPAKPAQ